MLTLCLTLALACFADESAVKAPTVTLLYEAEKPKASAETDLHMDGVLKMVKHRVESLHGAKADVRLMGTNRISISFPSDDAKLVERFKQLVGRSGAMEFRILANKMDPRHREAIRLAGEMKTDKGSEVRGADKQVIAKWVRFDPARVRLSDEFEVRKDAKDNDEVLALVDEFNVTDEYLTHVDRVASDNGPAVGFRLNAEGAKRFGELTSRNLPDPAANLGSELAIIVDDEVVTGAIIRSKITDTGEITGRFTDAEVDDFIAVLDSGRLPVTLKLVKESNGHE